MKPLNQFEFVRSPQDETYRQLLRPGLDFASRGILVLPSNELPGETGRQSLGKLNLQILEVVEQSEWPGTQLLEGTSTVFHFAFDYRAYEALSSAVSSLYDWIWPMMPEDLCLSRADETPWLISIAHERDAWLALHPGEFEDLQRKHGELAAHLY